jgi:4-amino-4-deoxy-L-arabinose transferase-like glycosyltransferase
MDLSLEKSEGSSLTRDGNALSLRRVMAWTVVHPVLAIFLLALTLRVIAAIGIYLFFDGTLFSDDVTYLQMAIQKASGLDAYWDNYTRYLYHSTSTFMVPLRLIYEVAGTNNLPGQLYVTTLGAGTAAATTAVGLHLTAKRWAVLAGLIVALMPSQILWSALVLKDAGVWLLLALSAAVFTVVRRSRGRNLLLSLTALALIVALMGYTRESTMIVILIASVLASWTGRSDSRRSMIAGIVAVTLLVPWAIGYGPFGIEVVRKAPPLETVRTKRAEGTTAFVNPADKQSDTPRAEPTTQIGDLLKGISVMLFEPVPWRTFATDSILLAQLETVVWYPMLALALAGIWSVRKRVRSFLYLLLLGIGSMLLFALTEGNIGTAYRHRGEFVWVVALFAALGVARVVSSRTHEPSTTV